MSDVGRQTGFTLLLLLLLSVLGYVSAFHFLVALPNPARSHYNVGLALAKGLAEAGHQVTLVSPFSLKEPIENITDIPVPNVLHNIEKKSLNLFDLGASSTVKQGLILYGIGLVITEMFQKEPAVEKLRRSNQTFDAVILDFYMGEAHFGLAEHFNAPLIVLNCYMATALDNELIGALSPPSYVPHGLLPYSSQMSLRERVTNLAILTLDHLYAQLRYLPEQERIYKTYFPANTQNFYDMRRNTSLLLLNQHPVLSFARPHPPNLIEVGGMHIRRQPQPLPADIEKFINGAEHGVIYFSMGSVLRSSTMSPEKRVEILKALGSLKQRVLWKFEEPDLPNRPENVYISDWFPQADILAHERVVAFITHGGLLSTTEAIYHGKPFVGIPVWFDQFFNMACAERNGYALTVSYRELTAAKLVGAIERILNDTQATKLVREMSLRYRDQPEEPLKRAVFWVEHVARHKGAHHLRSPSQQLNFIEYHNLDAWLILLAFLLSALYLLALSVRYAKNRLLSRGQVLGSKMKHS